MPFKGTDLAAWDKAAKGKTREERCRIYRAEKAKNGKNQKNTTTTSPNSGSDFGFSKFSKYNTPKSKPTTINQIQPKLAKSQSKKHTTSTKIQYVSSQATKPKNATIVSSFSIKQPLFAGKKTKAQFANSVVAKIQDYFISKLTDAAEELARIAIKKVLSYYLPIDMIEKIEKAYNFVNKVITYIKKGQEVYEVIVKITKRGRTVEVETSYAKIDFKQHEKYRSFYKSNRHKIRQFPDQINDEFENRKDGEQQMIEYMKYAKDIIKSRFGVDIEVEFIKKENLMQRRTELEKQYGREIEGIFGFFVPEADGRPAKIIVGYEDDNDIIEVFYHELQHAIDYYEVIARLGEQPKYFNYYTEYNAGFNGVLRYTLAMLETMPTEQEKLQFIRDSKNHCVKRFNSQDKVEMKVEMMDVLHYLSRISAFAQIEGIIDYTVLTELPKSQLFMELVNFINRYEPTQVWYTEFKKMIDSIIAK